MFHQVGTPRRHPMSSLYPPSLKETEFPLMQMSKFAWIISTSRLVQTQAALNEAVYIILRIQGQCRVWTEIGVPEG